MKKLWIIAITVIFVSFFAIRATDTTIYYEFQDDLDPTQTEGIFNNHPLTIPPFLPETKQARQVLGDSDGEKVIYVDLSNQRVYAYQGPHMIFNFIVSTGKWGRTPTGTFHIANKFRAAKMSGGSKELGTYYYLPNVPYIMFFGNSTIPASRGFSFHGTYWHNNFGTPMSHGCINMRTTEAALLYDWADPKLPEGKRSGPATSDNPGTKVIIYGVTPKS